MYPDTTSVPELEMVICSQFKQVVRAQTIAEVILARQVILRKLEQGL
jgi:hypothetical protein